MRKAPKQRDETSRVRAGAARERIHSPHPPGCTPTDAPAHHLTAPAQPTASANARGHINEHAIGIAGVTAEYAPPTHHRPVLAQRAPVTVIRVVAHRHPREAPNGNILPEPVAPALQRTPGAHPTRRALARRHIHEHPTRSIRPAHTHIGHTGIPKTTTIPRTARIPKTTTIPTTARIPRTPGSIQPARIPRTPGSIQPAR